MCRALIINIVIIVTITSFVQHKFGTE